MGLSENRSAIAYYRYHTIKDFYYGTSTRFNGAIRVAVFCLMTIILPCLLLVAPLYIRYTVFSDQIYKLGESDLIITVDRRISTFWCERQDLWMNASFHAYLLDEEQQISKDLQLFEIDKHVQLADDNLESWRFFLLQGSKVIISVCSRFNGTRLMVVKGNKSLKHCALLDNPLNQTHQMDPWEFAFRKGETDVKNYSKPTPRKKRIASEVYNQQRIEKVLVGVELDPEEDSVEDDEILDELDEETIDEDDVRSSGSSLAKNLWSCYGGDTLFNHTFSSSLSCQSQDTMMKLAFRTKTVHEIASTGYYYYIFYSDSNDIVSNDIFARLNIEKVVHSFPNYKDSCINTTKCSLPLNLFSLEKVLLQVPLQDGVSQDDTLSQTILISTCRPRLIVYLIFPVTILFLIICSAFM